MTAPYDDYQNRSYQQQPKHLNQVYGSYTPWSYVPQSSQSSRMHESTSNTAEAGQPSCQVPQDVERVSSPKSYRPLASTKSSLHSEKKSTVIKDDKYRICKQRQAAAKTNDEINFLIARLRVYEGWDWSQIAKKCNDAKPTTNGAKRLTDAAVYGRFKRNGSRLFVEHGLPPFDPSLYMHVKHWHDRKRMAAQQAALRNLGSHMPSQVTAHTAPSSLFVDGSNGSPTELGTEARNSQYGDGEDEGLTSGNNEATHDAHGDPDDNPATYNGTHQVAGVPNDEGEPIKLRRYFTHTIASLFDEANISSWDQVAARLHDHGYAGVTADGCYWYFQNIYALGTAPAPIPASW
ncbi:MAG: hypothetical protein Q9162_002546 [Coniocarpon cinnabarinum]